jgi:hypothetical protein
MSKCEAGINEEQEQAVEDEVRFLEQEQIAEPLALADQEQVEEPLDQEHIDATVRSRPKRKQVMTASMRTAMTALGLSQEYLQRFSANSPL